MKIKGLVDVDFVNYELPSMFIIFPKCTFKCDHDCGRPICQNGILANYDDIEISPKEIAERYLKNDIAKAIVIGGLEPFDSFEDLCETIIELRAVTNDYIVIYTGYEDFEIQDKIKIITTFGHIIIKFGRFIPDSNKYYNEILGVELASDNQYAVRYSNVNRHYS